MFGLAAVVWGMAFAHRISLVVGAGVFLCIAYVVGYEFWHAKFGPVPLTLDRLVLLGLLAAGAIQWRLGRLKLRRLTLSDWALLGLVSLLATSAAFSGEPDYSDGVTSKWGRLVTAFVVPGVLYFVVKSAPVTPRDWSWLLAGCAVLGTYLGATAVLETTGCWSLVFPGYIANPNLGIHFGRARGPDLNSASLGAYLTACLACAWILLGNATRRWQQLVLAAVLPLMAVGVLLTYTRSTWLGLAASGLAVAALQVPRRWRLPALLTAALGGLVVLAISWNQLMGLQREGTAAEAHHSVDQRTSFAYVSWKMFCDHPLLGVGFGRFYDRKLPYLSDRSQSFELESIRPLHHHNTLLGILTETGLVGLLAYLALLAAWCWQAWRLAAPGEHAPWARCQGILMLALLTNYLCSAVFHDLTLVPSQHWLLFVFAGLTVSVRQDHCIQTSGLGWRVAGRAPTTAPTTSPAVGGMRSIGLFGMQITRTTMRETIDRLLIWCGQPRSDACRFIVTPNVDHAVMFQHRSDLRAAYADASLVLADGTPIVLASRILGKPLPERVAGSDLVPALLDSSAGRLRVYLLGAAPGVAETAAANIARRWPRAVVVGTYSPPLGFEHNAAENARILAAIAAAQPDLLIVGLGAPKQELWVHRHRHQIQANVAVCAGATIDFLAGHKQRSPEWMRRTGLEWLHRVWTEPRRLAVRYAVDAWVFPQLVWREWWQSRALTAPRATATTPTHPV